MKYRLLVLLLALLSVFKMVPGRVSAVDTNHYEVGIFMPGANSNISTLANYEQSLGIKFDSARWYIDWSGGTDLTAAKNFHDHGVMPDLTWEPQISGAGVDYNRVLGGNYDSYISKMAQSVKALGFPIRIALGPEMNGDWSPWGTTYNNTTLQKQFWQYVVTNFRNNGVTNVQWIWAPNIHYGEPYSYAEIFPGDDYVDFVGLEGYNWGSTQSGGGWQTFSQVIGASYNDLLKISGKSIFLTETGSTELGGNKAAWITDMFNQLNNNYPRIVGFTWFNENKETDWRIDSSVSSKQAFVSGALSRTTASAPGGTVSSGSTETTGTTTSTGSSSSSGGTTSTSTGSRTTSTTKSGSVATKPPVNSSVGTTSESSTTSQAQPNTDPQSIISADKEKLRAELTRLNKKHNKPKPNRRVAGAKTYRRASIFTGGYLAAGFSLILALVVLYRYRRRKVIANF